MNDNGKFQYIVVRCGDSEMMIQYGNLGVTLIRGEHDQDGEFIIESEEQLPFADHPELRTLFSGGAWNGRDLLAVVEQACLEMPEA